MVYESSFYSGVSLWLDENMTMDYLQTMLFHTLQILCRLHRKHETTYPKVINEALKSKVKRQSPGMLDTICSIMSKIHLLPQSRQRRPCQAPTSEGAMEEGAVVTLRVGFVKDGIYDLSG